MKIQEVGQKENEEIEMNKKWRGNFHFHIACVLLFRDS
jgi:hypothetical protein